MEISKERADDMKIEYKRLKNAFERIHKANINNYALKHTDYLLDDDEKCIINLSLEQEDAMLNYMYCLERKAAILGINLEEPEEIILATEVIRTIDNMIKKRRIKEW